MINLRYINSYIKLIYIKDKLEYSRSLTFLGQKLKLGFQQD